VKESKPSEQNSSSLSLLQLVVGGTLAFAGVAAILRLSNLWTITYLKYAEYAVVLFWGVLLVVGALRHR
jgi:hypothetical protein